MFTAAVAVAEKAGKPITLLGLPSHDSYVAILQAAESLQSSRIVLDASAEDSAAAQRGKMEQAWSRMAGHSREVTVQIDRKGEDPSCFRLEMSAG